MPASKNRPKHAMVVRDFDKLEEYATKFAEGYFNLLIVIGGAGLSKSQTIRKAVGKKSLWVEATASAFGMYGELYRHRDQTVVIDDVDGLYTDKSAVNLLKCLCQTDPVKSVGWYTAAAGQLNPDVPKSFETRSKVCIIANEWKTLSANVHAVENRGHLLFFEPTPQAVHKKVAEWFWDQEVFDFFHGLVERNMLPGLTMRHYIRAAELKDAGMHWVDVLLSEGFAEKTLLVARLKADSSYETEADRIKAFKELGGGSRSTYFKHAAKLTSKRPKKMEPIKLRKRKPKLRVVG